MIQVNPINIVLSRDDNWSILEKHKTDLITQLKKVVEQDLPAIKLPFPGLCVVFMYVYVDGISGKSIGSFKCDDEIPLLMQNCIVQAGIVANIRQVNTFSAKMVLTDNNQSATISIHRIDLVPLPPMPKPIPPMPKNDSLSESPEVWGPPDVGEPPF